MLPNTSAMPACAMNHKSLATCCLQSTVGCVAVTTDPNMLVAALGSNVVEVYVNERKTGRILAFVGTGARSRDVFLLPCVCTHRW